MFSKQELADFKTIFADRDDLIYALRAHFLQLPLADNEKEMLSKLSPEAITLLRKRMLPELSNDFPLTQVADLFFTLTDDMKRLSVADMEPLFASKDLESDYLAQQLGLLDGSVADETIKLANLRSLKGKNGYTQMVDLTTHNFLIGYVDQMLNFIKMLAGAKEETPEEQEKRLSRDSTQ